MRPLRVRARMETPVVTFGDGLHLDGVVAWGRYLQMPPAERDALPSLGEAWADDFDLPLARWECEAVYERGAAPDDRLFVERPDRDLFAVRGRVWGWRASAVHARWLTSGVYEMRKPCVVAAVSRWGTGTSKLQVSSGRYKSWNRTYPTRFALVLEWYCVGDAAALRELLAKVWGVGKLCQHGLGKVLEWTVEESESDWSCERDGAITRVLPSLWCARGYLRRTAIRPPYHHVSRRVLAKIPDYEGLQPCE
jgi:CRISPR type IV-associated protein Csf3